MAGSDVQVKLDKLSSLYRIIISVNISILTTI